MAQESGIILEVSADGNTWSQLADLPAGTTSYQHTGLTAGTTRYYRAKAKGDGTTTADSPYTATVSATTTTTATALTAPTATVQPSTSVANALRINWGNIANNSGYQVQYSTDNSTWQEAGSVGAGVVTFLLEGLAADTLYYVRVRALGTGAYANSAYSATVSAYTSIYFEPWNAIDSALWTVTNPQPTRVAISSYNNNFLRMNALGAGTTSTPDNNNVAKITGITTYPHTLEMGLAIDNNAPMHQLGFRTDNDRFQLYRGYGTTTEGAASEDGDITIGVMVDGTFILERLHKQYKWDKVNAIRLQSDSQTLHRVLIRLKATGAWVQLGADINATITGEKKPFFAMGGGTGTKIMDIDYVIAYRHA